MTLQNTWTLISVVIHTYVVGCKSFWPDIQKPRQMENVARDISAIYGEVIVSVSGGYLLHIDYIEK